MVVVNKSVNEAKFSDMFKGDELATTKNVNLAKVQMFFFTIIIAISYGLTLYILIVTADSANLIQEFPALDESIIAILAISHAGYLGNKSIDQTAKKWDTQ